MNLKTKLIGFAIAAAVALGIAAPALAVDPASTSLTVALNDSGNLSIALSTLSGFSSASVNATTGDTKTGSVQLAYTDTQAYRGEFSVNLVASAFTSSVQVPYSSPTAYYSIPASNLKLVANYNPEQNRWTSSTLYPYRVGDIGLTDSSGGTHGSQANDVPYPWTSSNQLDTSKLIAKAYAGSGTDFTTQQLDLSLTVPPAMPAANYSSTLTATLTLTTP